MGLFNRVMAVDVLRIIKILRTLTAQPNRLTTLCDNCLAQVIVEVLFWVGIAGVEFANASMRHQISDQ